MIRWSLGGLVVLTVLLVLQNAYADDDVLSDSERCAQSSCCTDQGLCRADLGVCIAVEREDCAQSRACLEHGQCDATGEICVARSQDDCTNSERCTTDAECFLVEVETDDGWACGVESEDVCEQSGACYDALTGGCGLCDDESHASQWGALLEESPSELGIETVGPAHSVESCDESYFSNEGFGLTGGGE